MISNRETAHDNRFTFCSKCGSPARDEYDEIGEEQYSVCPNCKTDYHLITGPELPHIKEFEVKPLPIKESTYNHEEWLKKDQEKQDAKDAKLDLYFNDCVEMGEEKARAKYLNNV